MNLRIRSQIYIIGAGLAGISIANEIKQKGIFGRVVAFLDDDPSKTGRRINGVPILGPLEDILNSLDTTAEDEALIALPGETREEIGRIYSLLRHAGFARMRIRILPGLSQMLYGEAHLIQTREINPEDLLSRKPVKLSLKQSISYVRGRRVLVTGAGGSIGSELSRQLLSGGAERLYLLGHGENSIYGIDRELRILQEEGVGEKATIVPVVGELQDRSYMFHILKRLRADVVFHTAAYKHVPMMEANPVAAVQNNIFGTKNLVEASVAAGIGRFVMISTDKAVDASCIYGASKFLAEQLVIRERRNGKDYIVVRFGNVLGSRGSIVPLFRKQILKGGPVTLTHPESSRFFMTISEACSLVLKAGGIDVDGDLVLLDMGEPVFIKDLAEQMIRFYDYEPERDIKVTYIGLKPGEKLHEALWSEREHPEKTDFPKILKVRSESEFGEELVKTIEDLEPICFYDESAAALFRNRKALKRVLRRMVPTLRTDENEPEY